MTDTHGDGDEDRGPDGDGEPGGALVVVDAANVVGSRPDGWWRDRAAAARRLVDDVAAALGHTPGDTPGDPPDVRPGSAEAIVVVLEGKARAGVPAHTGHRLHVVHADGSGDDAIVALVRDEVERRPDRHVIVVTSDRGLRDRAERLGARTRGARCLTRGGG